MKNYRMLLLVGVVCVSVLLGAFVVSSEMISVGESRGFNGSEDSIEAVSQSEVYEEGSADLPFQKVVLEESFEDINHIDVAKYYFEDTSGDFVKYNETKDYEVDRISSEKFGKGEKDFISNSWGGHYYLLYKNECEKEIRELNPETMEDVLVDKFINCADSLYGDYGVFRDYDTYYRFGLGADDELVSVQVVGLKNGNVIKHQNVDQGWIYGGLSDECVRPQVMWGERRHNEINVTSYQDCEGVVDYSYFVSG